MTTLTLQIDSLEGTRTLEARVDDLIIAGWTGRNREAMEHHIAELEALGVKRPPRTPMYYRVSASRLTQAGAIDVLGEASSGEAEYVLVSTAQGLFVGIGSDHTDREAETQGITLSKQLCEKPVGMSAWPFEEVAGHWDEMVLRSYATIDGKRTLYQEGSMAAMLAPQSLLEGLDGGALPPGWAMFGGTIGAIGGIRPATRFECEIEDPRHGAS